MALPVVYIARGLESGLFKVGRSLRVETRIHSLAMAAEPMELMARIPGPLSMESEMHRLFAASQAGTRGREWFRDDGVIVAFLETLPASRRESKVFRVVKRGPQGCRPSSRPGASIVPGTLAPREFFDLALDGASMNAAHFATRLSYTTIWRAAQGRAVSAAVARDLAEWSAALPAAVAAGVCIDAALAAGIGTVAA